MSSSEELGPAPVPSSSPSTCADGRDQCAHGQRPVARTDQRGGRRVAAEGPSQAGLLTQHDVLRVLRAGLAELFLHDVRRQP